MAQRLEVCLSANGFFGNCTVYKLVVAALLIACAVVGCQCFRTAAIIDEDNHVDSADNSYCYVCHINYKSEDIAIAHENKGIGCETCHGMSDDHSSDENGLCAPGRMFARDKITAYCTTCHSQDDLRKVEKHLRFVFTDNSEKRKVCTDCHGKHRLENRTRKWNKDTGVLSWKDGAPIMDQH